MSAKKISLFQTHFRFNFCRVLIGDEIKFRLRIGLKGFLPQDYIALENCAYAKNLRNIVKFDCDTRKEAQEFLHKTKNWFLERQKRFDKIRLKSYGRIF